MTSMSNKAIYIFTLAFLKMAVCQVCRPHSIEACYGAIAMSLLRDLVKPPFGEIELDASMQTICEKRIPVVSRCLPLVNDCQKERRENFTNLENIYRGFHNTVCTQDSFDGLRGLWNCLDRQRRKKCDKDTDELFGATEYSIKLHCQIARNYSVCLQEVTRDCPPKFDEGKKALKRITDGAVDTLCSSWRDLQTRSSEVSPSVTGGNEPLSTPQFSSSTAVQAVGVMTTPSSQLEGSTTKPTDQFERQHALTTHHRVTTVQSLFNGSATTTSVSPHASVTSQISTENLTSGNASLCLGGAGTYGIKCKDPNEDKQSQLVPASSATSALFIASLNCAFVFACSWLTLLSL